MNILNQKKRDFYLIQKWKELTDVPFGEADTASGLVLAQDWWVFRKGTDREEIWLYFDVRYSKGVYSLLYEPEETKDADCGSFIVDVLSGKAAVAQIDEYVEYWHENEIGCTLQEFLGFTDEECAIWLNSDDPKVLAEIINSRNAVTD